MKPDFNTMSIADLRAVGSETWDGQVRRVEINASETEALVGMGLLEDYKLEIEGRSGGAVKVTALLKLQS